MLVSKSKGKGQEAEHAMNALRPRQRKKVELVALESQQNF